MGDPHVNRAEDDPCGSRCVVYRPPRWKRRKKKGKNGHFICAHAALEVGGIVLGRLEREWRKHQNDEFR